jgi:hypothetical protein
VGGNLTENRAIIGLDECVRCVQPQTVGVILVDPVHRVFDQVMADHQ